MLNFVISAFLLQIQAVTITAMQSKQILLCKVVLGLYNNYANHKFVSKLVYWKSAQKKYCI